MKQTLLLFFLFVVEFGFAQTQSHELLQKAKEAFDSKKFGVALKLYDQLITTEKANAEAFFWRGRTKVELKDLEGAKKDFESVLKLNPASLGTLLALGNVYSLLNDFDNAIRYNKMAEEIDSLSEEVIINRGNIYYALKKYDLAIPQFTRAIILDSTDKGLYKVRADCYNFTGAMHLARQDLESILKIDSNDIHAKTNLGFLNILSEDFEKANKLYENLYQTETNNPYILSNFGYVKHVLGNSSEGLKFIMRSLEIMPQNSYAYKYLAAIYVSQNDLKKSMSGN